MRKGEFIERTKCDIKSDNIYRFYKTMSLKPVDKKTFISVWEDYIDWGFTENIFKGRVFKLPYIGDLQLKKKKVCLRERDGKINKRYLKIDYKRTKELWNNDPVAKKEKKLIFHLNQHTGGFYYKISWDKRYARKVANITYFKFVFVRKWKRMIAQILKDNPLEAVI